MAAKQNTDITYEEIVRRVRAKDYSPIYYLMGDESYYIDKISEFIVDSVLTPEEKDFNLTVIYGADTDAATVADAALRYPMMASYQVVLVREAQALADKEQLVAYLAHPQPTTILILCHKHGTLDRRKKLASEIQKKGILFESKKLYDSQLPGFVSAYLKRHGAVIEPTAIQILCSAVGADLTRLSAEMDKLLLSLEDEGRKVITADHIEQHIGVSKDFNNFELVNALVEKDVFKANQIVNYFDSNPKNFSMQMTLSVLFNFYSNLMLAYYAPQKNEDGIAQWLEQPRWQVTRNIIPAMRKYSGVKVMQIVAALRQTDARSKGVGGSNVPNGSLLRELIYFILH